MRDHDPVRESGAIRFNASLTLGAEGGREAWLEVTWASLRGALCVPATLGADPDVGSPGSSAASSAICSPLVELTSGRFLFTATKRSA